ncbi:hypothetical protein XH93_11280 [Bradyrhizobium sp. CCBAU 51753]|nr:hypothetical protein XH93_11280 [Bradyrhizobium sp. CCBAU 51753]
MDFDDLIVMRAATADRPDRHFYEGAVMLAYAMRLFRTEPVREVKIHPDGQHAQQIDFLAAGEARLPKGRVRPAARSPVRACRGTADHHPPPLRSERCRRRDLWGSLPGSFWPEILRRGH